MTNFTCDYLPWKLKINTRQYYLCAVGSFAVSLFVCKLYVWMRVYMFLWFICSSETRLISDHIHTQTLWIARPADYFSCTGCRFSTFGNFRDNRQDIGFITIAYVSHDICIGGHVMDTLPYTRWWLEIPTLIDDTVERLECVHV